MPKTQFLNLSKEKRQKILLAAKEEFINYSFAEASINRIIKQADIARGSFYVYFEDKEDIYLTLMDTFLIRPFLQTRDLAPKTKVNVFDYTIQIFTQWSKVIDSEPKLSHAFFNTSTIEQKQQLFNETLFDCSSIRFDTLRFQAPREQKMLLYTLNTILFSYLQQYSQQTDNFNTLKTQLLKHLLLLKVGCQK